MFHSWEYVSGMWTDDDDDDDAGTPVEWANPLGLHQRPYMNVMGMPGLLWGSTDEGWSVQMAAQFYNVQQSIKIGHDRHNANNAWGGGRGRMRGDLTLLKCRLVDFIIFYTPCLSWILTVSSTNGSVSLSSLLVIVMSPLSRPTATGELSDSG